MKNLLALLDTLDRLEGKATPGPWRTEATEGQELRVMAEGLVASFWWSKREPDTELVTTLRNAYPTLARALRAAWQSTLAERLVMARMGELLSQLPTGLEDMIPGITELLKDMEKRRSELQALDAELGGDDE